MMQMNIIYDRGGGFFTRIHKENLNLSNLESESPSDSMCDSLVGVSYLTKTN